MSTVYLFYKGFCILKNKVALIGCRWSKAQLKAGENNGLIRPPAECAPGLNNREIASISSPCEVGIDTQTSLALPFGSELVGVNGLASCSAYGYILLSFMRLQSFWTHDDMMRYKSAFRNTGPSQRTVLRSFNVFLNVRRKSCRCASVLGRLKAHVTSRWMPSWSILVQEINWSVVINISHLHYQGFNFF